MAPSSGQALAIVVYSLTSPSLSQPPSLPPTVEEAYRRKCIQLRARTNEIEEENDAYRLRATRLKRQIQKLRLERAILLEQIQKRTSTNVEDSEGSPSPPPTPEDKPLRVKRGHRKTSLVPGGDRETGSAGPSFISQTMRGLSPGSEFSHGDSFSAPKRPSNAFEIYCNDMRPVLQEKHKDEIAAGEFRLEEELARGWKDLPQTEKDEFQARYEQELTKWREGRDAFRRAKKGGGRARHSDFDLGRSSTNIKLSRATRPADEEEQDQDVEMGDAEAEAAAEAAAEAEEAEQEEQNDTDPETEVDDGQDQGDD
ncbi:hmg box protein [Apiospora hydei]|uniref:Hmg box protein n=1 Tax=Apiospora hydei TaxID=1337664 RepID=A0ABR1V5Y3_9PEZI